MIHLGHFTSFVGPGTMGAAILAGRACLRSAVGLLTYVTTKNVNEIIQTPVPEAMTILVNELEIIGGDLTELPASTIGIGPGIATSNDTTAFVEKLLTSNKNHMVIDADALNIIAAHQGLK